MSSLLKQSKLVLVTNVEEQEVIEVSMTDSEAADLPAATKFITRLRYRQTDSEDDTKLQETAKEVIPKWIASLSPYFEFLNYTGKKTAGTPEVTMKCKECSKKNAKHKGITGRGKHNFARHLKLLHPNQNQNYLEADSPTHSTHEIIKFPVQMRSADKYRSTDLKQKAFDSSLLQFVVMDSVPFSSVDRPGLKNLIHTLDPKLQIPSRRTLLRRITVDHEKVVAALKRKIALLKEDSCHLIFDIWSTRQKESVLGVKLRYVSNWKLFHEVLCFKSFPDSHTGENIKRIIFTNLEETYGLKMEQVASVTADNASNVLAAFRILDLEGNSDFSQADLHNYEEVDYAEVGVEGDQEFTTNEDIDYDDLDYFEWINEPADESEPANLDAPSCSPRHAMRLNGCLAHLLQLAVKDALRRRGIVHDAVQMINNVVNFFHKSNRYYGELRSKINGLSLLKPCATRWNSLYHCLKRITSEQREGVDIVASINEVLASARRNLKGKQKKNIPKDISDDELALISHVTLILEPLAELTDDLQSDGVTSSLVILGVLNAVKRCSQITVRDDDFEAEHVRGFRDDLLESLITRFTKNRDAGDTVMRDGKQSRIVTTDVFHDKAFILATLLDPRIKSTPFKSNNTAFQVPSETEAIEILRSYFSMEKCQAGLEELSESQDLSLPPLNKRRCTSTMFDYVEELNVSASPMQLGEIEEYMKLPLVNYSHSPMQFWEANEAKFPVLSKLSRKFLAIPATSGAIERLFSTAGALVRCRRAKIKIPLMEKTLMMRQHIQNMLD